MTYSEELYEMVELLAKQVSAESSEEKKVTILNNIKPSSFAWIIDSVLDFIEQRKDICGNNCIVCGRDVYNDVFYDVNGGTICKSCMDTKCKCIRREVDTND